MTLREKEGKEGGEERRKRGIESRDGKDIAKICISFYKFRTVYLVPTIAFSQFWLSNL